MKFEIELPEDKVEPFYLVIKEWKELVVRPLTNFIKLKELENKIGLELAYVILQGDYLNNLELKMKTNQISEAIEENV